MAAGSLLMASQKAGPELAVIPSHAVSAKSQTLEKPSFPLIAPHAMSGVCSQVGDEGLEPTCVSPTNNRVLRITGIPAGPNLSLGELTCRLIERWDELDESVKAEIAELLRRW